ncbi:hypothetical protein OIV83_004182 [Microbotryomycetes sp. JL201]|nr:hypothetical protein OIV83_004182 [Microbotryomycetes sp. JL201]
MVLTQQDVVDLMAKDPNVPQHIAFQYLCAYVYCKSSRGNLPTETLSKVMSIQRRLTLKHGAVPSNSPRGRAFEAMKVQLAQVSRRWMAEGPYALGPLGQIGAASTIDARWAWTKATDGKVKEFPTEQRVNVEVDAGRLQPAAWGLSGYPSDMDGGGGTGDSQPQTPAFELPQYQPPSESNQTEAQQVEQARADAALAPSNGHQTDDADPGKFLRPDGTPMSPEEVEIEKGRRRLAKLREQREQAEREREERERALHA